MQKHVNLVDLVKSFPTNIFLQNLASIQKRTSRIKFAHLAEKSEKGSISNPSTKVHDALQEAPRDGLRHPDGWRRKRKRQRKRVRSCKLFTAVGGGTQHFGKISNTNTTLQNLPIVCGLVLGTSTSPVKFAGQPPAGSHPGLQIRGSKFQSSNSNSRELELTNLLGLVLGCIEAKFCK